MGLKTTFRITAVVIYQAIGAQLIAQRNLL
jgi:hypothetical protein